MKKYKIAIYCQVGSSLEMAQFSLQSAIANMGMPLEDVKLIFICWKTSREVYQWLHINDYHYVDMIYDEGKGFLWNLYKGWNLGYTEGYKFADYVCPIATDHAFYKDWLKNMYAHAQSNRIVNCKLIEPGTLHTMHTAINFGLTKFGEFNLQSFNNYCQIQVKQYKGVLAKDETAYGHRFDAMPFICPIDVWERIGPMKQVLNENDLPGDVDFFDRCKLNGVELTKALDGISYHCGGLETKKNKAKGVYT